MGTAMYHKCTCNCCSGHIEFPEEMAGQTVECPHCKIETRLYVLTAEPALIETPSEVKGWYWTKIVLLGGTIFGVAALLWRLITVKPELAADLVSAFGGGFSGAAILLIIIFTFVLWIFLPLIVFFSLETLKRELRQSNKAFAEMIYLLNKVEDNTEKTDRVHKIDKESVRIASSSIK